MSTLTPREELIVKIQRKLSDLSKSQLRTIATAIDDGSAAGIADDLNEMELYELIIKYIRGEKLRRLEDEGMTQLQLLDDLVSGLLSTDTRVTGDRPVVPHETGDVPNQHPSQSDRQLAMPAANVPDQPNNRHRNAGIALAIAGAVAGGVGAVLAAPVVLGAVGFTSAGIAAGSFAASMMSAAAVANGGAVAAGSLVAILQSAGAAGLSAAATAAVAGAGGGVGAGVGLLASKLHKNKEDTKEDGDEKKKDRERKKEEKKKEGDGDREKRKKEGDEEKKDGEEKKKGGEGGKT